MPRMTYSRQWNLSSHSMRLATFLSITVALILIAPIALASPPDPCWVSGIYDGADGDDVVSLIYDTAGVEAVLLGSVLPLLGSSTVLPVSRPGAIHGFPLHQFPRGPPFSSSLIVSDVFSRLRRPAGFHAHIALRSVTRFSGSVRMRAFHALAGDDDRLRELAPNGQFDSLPALVKRAMRRGRNWRAQRRPR